MEGYIAINELCEIFRCGATSLDRLVRSPGRAVRTHTRELRGAVTVESRNTKPHCNLLVEQLRADRGIASCMRELFLDWEVCL
jgi:hypothetical protein